MRESFQPRGRGRLVLLAVVCLAAWGPVVRLAQPPGSDVRDPAIRASALLAVMLWAAGVAWVCNPRHPGSHDSRPGFRGHRWCWTAGCAAAWLHMAVAMHAGHGWSHDAAYRHTAEVGGYGWGVYVNVAFGLVWLADVAWMWAAPTAYRRRPRWVGWAVHGFLAFIVFNATVVFATDPALRAAALLFTIWLAWQVAKTRRNTSV